MSSIFAFPLIVGPLKLGSVDLYSRDPVALDAERLQRAATLAAIIGRHVLRERARGGDRATTATRTPVRGGPSIRRPASCSRSSACRPTTRCS